MIGLFYVQLCVKCGLELTFAILKQKLQVCYLRGS